MASCKFCQKDITWIKEGRKNIPVDSDGGKHHCEEMTISFKSIKQIDRNELSAEEIKRYEEAINNK
jgi:hypothetical protein